MWRAVQFNLKPSLADNARATTHPIRYTDNALWTAKRRKITGIETGYALDEGLWLQHSWGIQREGILETTVLREKYFGILFWSVVADAFANVNVDASGTAR
jgi:hypothetical protein